MGSCTGGVGCGELNAQRLSSLCIASSATHVREDFSEPRGVVFWKEVVNTVSSG